MHQDRRRHFCRQSKKDHCPSGKSRRNSGQANTASGLFQGVLHFIHPPAPLGTGAPSPVFFCRGAVSFPYLSSIFFSNTLNDFPWMSHPLALGYVSSSERPGFGDTPSPPRKFPAGTGEKTRCFRHFPATAFFLIFRSATDKQVKHAKAGAPAFFSKRISLVVSRNSRYNYVARSFAVSGLSTAAERFSPVFFTTSYL